MTALVERLRAYRSMDPEWGDMTHHSICDEAADRIEALEAALEKLACRHVIDQPLWWQLDARTALSEPNHE